ncbi:hypothetical protein M2103_001273 [Ereboglobus sp. PH5-5]|uniref:hypothetical protein n=1 Tax=Ereboglobus sp. PH5-5 TaxID=2940529 RepID=UPI0024070B72|nr:hypothetical protein [Ereboglobus sp. PH5-5]MDF9833056.1 hypothetical protein [Ereboglobus sp. PH5-5]
MNFDALIKSIADIHRQTHASATKAVNTALTMRNWLIGACIQEFELHGEDRATYGDTYTYDHDVPLVYNLETLLRLAQTN